MFDGISSGSTSGGQHDVWYCETTNSLANVAGKYVIVGESNWSDYIIEETVLVDKTPFLKIFVENGKTSDIVFRPRRFGKSIFLSMLFDFFNVPVEQDLETKKGWFQKLLIGKDSEFVNKYCGQYPVILIDLKAVSGESLRSFHRGLTKVMSSLIDTWQHTWKSPNPEMAERVDYLKNGLINEISDIETDLDACKSFLLSLSQYLTAYYDKPFIILVDEYDAPIKDAPDMESSNTIGKHVSKMLLPLLKGNKDKFKGLLVGIDPLNLDYVDSGLNNLNQYRFYDKVNEAFDDKVSYSNAFGFTHSDVRKVLETRISSFGGQNDMLTDALATAEKWYDGYYSYEDVRLFNPWSVMNFAKSITKGFIARNPSRLDWEKRAKPYWNQSTSPTGFSDLFKNTLSSIKPQVLDLINDFISGNDKSDPRPQIGMGIIQTDPRPYDDSSGDDQTDYIRVENNYQTLDTSRKIAKTQFTSRAYYGGYLTAVPGNYVRIPNLEVLENWYNLLEWAVPADDPSLPIRLLINHKFVKFAEHIATILCTAPHLGPSSLEKVYHQLLHMELYRNHENFGYILQSELNAGNGRADIILTFSKDADKKAGSGTKEGILFEIKRPKIEKRDEETAKNDPEWLHKRLKEAVGDAERQIDRRSYRSHFEPYAKRLIVISIAFWNRSFCIRINLYELDSEKWVLSKEQPKKINDDNLFYRVNYK